MQLDRLSLCFICSYRKPVSILTGYLPLVSRSLWDGQRNLAHGVRWELRWGHPRPLSAQNHRRVNRYVVARCVDIVGSCLVSLWRRLVVVGMTMFKMGSVCRRRREVRGPEGLDGGGPFPSRAQHLNLQSVEGGRPQIGHR